MHRTPDHHDETPATRSLTPEQREDLRSRGYSETEIEELEREHAETRRHVRQILTLIHLPIDPGKES